MVREGVRQLVERRRGVRAAAEPRSGVRALALELPAQLQPRALRRRRAGAARAQPADARAVRRLPRRRRRLRDAQRRAGRRGAHARAGWISTGGSSGGCASWATRAARSTSSTRRRSPRWSRRSIREQVVAGLHARVDRFVRPEQLTAGLAAATARGRRRDPRGLRAARRSSAAHGGWALDAGAGDRLSADRVVVAAGLPTAPLLRRLGVRVPLHGRARLQRHDRRPRRRRRATRSTSPRPSSA